LIAYFQPVTGSITRPAIRIGWKNIAIWFFWDSSTPHFPPA